MKVRAVPKSESVRNTKPDGTRLYTTPMGDFPSVTTVLSGSRDNSHIELWRESIGEEKADEITRVACWRGDKHHENIEYLLETGKEPKTDFVTVKYWNSTREFLNRVRKTLVCEGSCWHPRKFAGAFDCLAYLDDDTDQPTLLDWKTADRIRKPDKIYEYKCQVAAYTAAVNHVYKQFGVHVTRAMIVVAIPYEKPQIEVVEEDSLNQLFDHFLARLERYYL